MKTYPSIPASRGQSFREFQAYVFDKLDGSNLRFEWSRKKGWHKYGTRTRLFDDTDPVFGDAVALFQSTLAQPLHDRAKSERWDSVIVFCEYWGEKSFAGLHDPSDPKRLTLFDVAPYKQGIIGPKEFLKLFGELDIPSFLGQINWTREFVDRVYRREIDGITLEGVVGKAKSKRHDLVMAKAKTKEWVDMVKAKFAPEEADKIINS